RYAAAQESSRTGMPLMRALVLLHPLDQESRESVDEYYFGPDLLVAPVLSAATQRSIHLPEGEWWNYWNGKHYTGPVNIVEDAPLDRIPLYVKSGAILPKIPEDVMTLASVKADAASPIKGLDDRRVYEIYPEANSGQARDVQDFENRHLTLKTSHGTSTLKITGPAAAITLVWRFQQPKQVMLNGHLLTMHPGDASTSVEFAHTANSELSWQQ
ncbi:MAG TPA: hypothetical protein VNX22_08910, partial [Acidobacteriaceae bacterium]|nr:hypothetical protein [Acidobacteriaceae bacterium]